MTHPIRKIADDPHFMALALQLAQRGHYTTAPNPNVGCVLTQYGQMIGQGWHAKAGGPHAEVVALRNATQTTAGATAYITLEPCCHHGRTPPCTQALIDAKISRVVVAMLDPNPLMAGKGVKILQNHGIEVQIGLFEEQAQRLNLGYIKRMTEHKPWLRSKIAMSLDGRTALASGVSQWITQACARQDVQDLRAQSCAIITGIETVLHDDPLLTIREPSLLKIRDTQPYRVILDTQLRLSATAKLFQVNANVLVFTKKNDPQKISELQTAGAEIMLLPPHDSQRIPVDQVLQELASRQMNNVMLECGATLNGAFLTAKLIDELVIYMAPSLLGDTARGAFHLPHIQTIPEKVSLEMIDIRAVGKDWRIIAKPLYKKQPKNQRNSLLSDSNTQGMGA